MLVTLLIVFSILIVLGSIIGGIVIMINNSNSFDYMKEPIEDLKLILTKENVAKPENVTASYTRKTPNEPHKAFNGTPGYGSQYNRGWFSYVYPGDNKTNVDGEMVGKEWLEIDLEKPILLKKIQIQSETNYKLKKIMLVGRNDKNKPFEKIYENFEDLEYKYVVAQRQRMFTVLSTDELELSNDYWYRYIRLVVLESTNDKGMSVSELKLFGHHN